MHFLPISTALLHLSLCSMFPPLFPCCQKKQNRLFSLLPARGTTATHFFFIYTTRPPSTLETSGRGLISVQFGGGFAAGGAAASHGTTPHHQTGTKCDWQLAQREFLQKKNVGAYASRTKTLEYIKKSRKNERTICVL